MFKWPFKQGCCRFHGKSFSTRAELLRLLNISILVCSMLHTVGTSATSPLSWPKHIYDQISKLKIF